MFKIITFIPRIASKIGRLSRNAASRIGGPFKKMAGAAHQVSKRGVSKLKEGVTVVSTKMRNMPRWVTATGVSIAGGLAMDSALQLVLGTVCKDSVSKDALNEALYDAAVEIRRNKPTNLEYFSSVLATTQFWSVVPQEILDVVEEERKDEVGTNLVRYAATESVEYSRDFELAAQSFVRNVRAVRSSAPSNDFLARETSYSAVHARTDQLKKAIVDFSRLIAVSHLMLDQLSEEIGLEIAPLARTTSLFMSKVALVDREILSDDMAIGAVRHFASHFDKCEEIDDKYADCLAAVDPDLRSIGKFFPLIF